MTATIPNLWEGKFSQFTVTPLAVLRTHAANFNSQTGGLLRAEVESRVEENAGAPMRLIAFDIVAPTLDYRQGVLTVEHFEPGAYPSWVRSSFWGYGVGNRIRCDRQSELVKRLEEITQDQSLLTAIESLIAQINDANSDGE